MPTQLTLDFTLRPRSQGQPIIQNESWLDESDIAHGVGFTDTVQVSVALNDALIHQQNERNSNYDQILYDVLWLAHFKLSLAILPCATFNFIIEQKDRRTEDASVVCLRLRVETQNHIVLLAFLEDF